MHRNVCGNLLGLDVDIHRNASRENLCNPIRIQQNFFRCSLPNCVALVIQLWVTIQSGLNNAPRRKLVRLVGRQKKIPLRLVNVNGETIKISIKTITVFAYFLDFF
jgi:hypothetical protein